MPNEPKANLSSPQIIFVGFVFCFAFVHIFGQAVFVAVVVPYVLMFESESLNAEFLSDLIEFGQKSFQAGLKYGWASTICYAVSLIGATFGFGFARRPWQSVLIGFVFANIAYWATIYVCMRLDLGDAYFLSQIEAILLMWAGATVGGAANGWLLALGARSLDRRAAQSNNSVMNLT
ncbi:MAG: hypothetical protein AAF585_07520 [Verrucomicrobiota bacterium]